MTRIIISGGGTGGHIFPAIAIANAIKTKEIKAEILFIGARGRMEMEKIPAAGYPIRGLWISGLQRKLTFKNLSFPFKVAHSLYVADRILAEFRPDAVIGVGGYASGPTLRAAIRRKIPSLIQEQNSYPGITNKILASKVNRICVAYEGMEKFFPPDKIIITGNPVRQDLIATLNKDAGLDYFNLTRGKPVVLVIGGSLGAGTINQAVLSYLKSSPPDIGFQLLWQTGKYYHEQIITNPVASQNKNASTHAFIDRMDLAYAAADIIVSRAGAIAISELCIIGKPVILIPSPNVAEDHQTKNAEALVRKSAALMLTDRECVERLFPLVENLSGDKILQSKLGANLKLLGMPGAAGDIANETFKLLEK